MEIAILIGGLIGLIIGGLIGAILLRAAAKWVLKEDIAFGSAFGTVLTFTFINFLIGFLIGIATSSARSGEVILIATVLSWILGFFMQSWIISARHNTSFGRACLVSLTMLGIVICIAIVVLPIMYFLQR